MELAEQEILLVGEVELDGSVSGGGKTVGFMIMLSKGHCLQVVSANLVRWRLPSERYVCFGNEAWCCDDVVFNPGFEAD